MKEIAVLLTCYNRLDVTRACLRSLEAQNMPLGYQFKVYLVDDASPDRTGEMIKKEFPFVNVIMGAGDLYWCGGMRLAWERARSECEYDFYLWLNDDVYLYEGAVASLLRDYEIVAEREKVGLIAGTFYEDNDAQRISYGCTSKGVAGRLKPNGKPQSFTATMSGNLVLVPQSVFDEIGSLSKEFTHGIADYDYAYRARKAGFYTWCGSLVHGYCKGNSGFNMKLIKKMTLKERIGVLYSPKAFALDEYCIYKKRYWGWRWVGSWIKAWLTVLMPNIMLRWNEFK